MRSRQLFLLGLVLFATCSGEPEGPEIVFEYPAALLALRVSGDYAVRGGGNVECEHSSDNVTTRIALRCWLFRLAEGESIHSFRLAYIPRTGGDCARLMNSFFPTLKSCIFGVPVGLAPQAFGDIGQTIKSMVKLKGTNRSYTVSIDPSEATERIDGTVVKIRLVAPTKMRFFEEPDMAIAPRPDLGTIN